MLWLVPLCPLVPLAGRRRWWFFGGVVAAGLLTELLFPHLHHYLFGDPRASWVTDGPSSLLVALVGLRSLVLLALFGLCLHSARPAAVAAAVLPFERPARPVRRAA
jgi:hypothetical protein